MFRDLGEPQEDGGDWGRMDRALQAGPSDSRPEPGRPS